MQVLTICSTVYPAYATFKASTSDDKASMSRWLEYWMIFAIASMAMPILDTVGAYMPFYFEAKIAFFVWLVADKFQGATVLSKKFVEPFLATHRAAIDEQLDYAYRKCLNIKVDDVRAAAEWAQAKAKKAPELAAAAKAAVDKVAKAPEQADKPQEPEEEKPEVVEKENKKEM